MDGPSGPRSRRWRGLAVALLAGSLLLFAGAGAAAEKVAVVAVGSNFVNFLPLTHWALNIRLLQNVLFDGLTLLDDSYQPKPALAASWTVSADRLEYVFKLRPGVLFHDGSPLTAEDVRWSLEVICHKDSVRIAELYVTVYASVRGCREYHEGRAERVDGLEALDGHTLRVRFTEPNAAFLPSTAVTAILPRARFAGTPVKSLSQHPLARAPIGSGPFSFVEWRDGDRLVLRANPKYFLGRPKLDGLVIRVIEDAATRFLEFKNGGLHFAILAPVSVQDFTAAMADSRLAPKAYRGAWNRFLALDLTSPLFADVRVRQALGHAFDRDRMLKDAWGGRGRIISGPLHPGLREFHPRIAVPEYDPARAKRLLAEAGWKPGDDGILRKDGRRFEFALTTYAGPSRTMAVLYHDYLKRLGMDVKIETVDFPTFWSTRYRPGQFQAASFHSPVGYDVEASFRLAYYECATSRIGYCSRETDALIARSRGTADPGERTKLYWTLQEKLAREMPVIWMVTPDDLQLASAKLRLPERDDEFLVMMSARHWDLRE